MKFTIDSKVLKNGIEKVMTVVDKKATLPMLTAVYFYADEKGKVNLMGTNLEHWIEIENITFGTEGAFGISVADVNVLMKMYGDIIMEDITEKDEKKIIVTCGKKTVTFHGYEMGLEMPKMKDDELILNLDESWLLETMTNLYYFTGTNEKHKMFQYFHFDTNNRRVDACDGYRIGIRSLESQKIEKVAKNDFENVLLNNTCALVFKKVLNKKGNSIISIFQDKKFVNVVGDDFSYIERRIDGEYFKLNRMFGNEANYSFTPDTKGIASVLKYDYDLLKGTRKPVVIHASEGKLYMYAKSSKYEMLDEIDIRFIDMSDNLFVGFDPHFLLDAFSIVDTDEPICRGCGTNGPLYIDGNEYSFLVLPVNAKGLDDIDGMINQIKRREAA